MSFNTFQVLANKWTKLTTSSRSKQDLVQQLNDLKTELASLRVQKISGGSASKLTKM